MKIIRFIALYIACILCTPSLCLANAYGTAKYEVTHVPSKKELHVKVEFDVEEGVTELLFPISFMSSTTVQTHIKDIVFSIPTSRIEYQNNMYTFFSSSTEHITVNYTIKNPQDLTQSIPRSPYVSSEGFYLNNGFLIFPNVKLSDSGDILLKSKVKFNIPSNNVLYSSSNGYTEKNQFTDLIIEVDKKSRKVSPEDIFFIGGSLKFLKTDRITTKNGQIDLLFFGIDSKVIPYLTTSSKKIYDIEQSLFGPTKKLTHIPFTAFIDNTQVRAINGGEFGENFHGSIMYFLGTDPGWATVLGHEYIHNWINSYMHTSFIDHVLYKWFFEGFTEYYAWKTTLDGGLITKEQAMVRLNLFSPIARLNPLWKKSYLEIASANYPFQISYHKGFLLAAELDQKILTATDGRYSLDDAMRSLVKKFQSGTKFSKELLKSEVKQLAGSSFDDIFGAIEYGDKFTPTPTPFGIKTKLKYIPTYLPKYGFDIGSSAITQKITRLDKNSPAYKAGIREGNFYLRDRNQFQSEANPGPQTVPLVIGTDAGEKTITYTTESEKIMVPQYEIVE